MAMPQPAINNKNPAIVMELRPPPAAPVRLTYHTAAPLRGPFIRLIEIIEFRSASLLDRLYDRQPVQFRRSLCRAAGRAAAPFIRISDSTPGKCHRS